MDSFKTINNNIDKTSNHLHKYSEIISTQKKQSNEKKGSFIMEKINRLSQKIDLSIKKSEATLKTNECFSTYFPPRDEQPKTYRYKNSHVLNERDCNLTRNDRNLSTGTFFFI